MLRLWWRLVRFGFRLLYNEFAFTYDWVSKFVSLGAWRCWQRSALKHLPANPGLMLEIAHGTGDLQIDLHAAGYRSIGYDLSPNMGKIARRKLLKHDQIPRLARGMAQQLPFPTGKFAAVVSTFPADFIIAPETLREIYRVLQPEGRLIIVPGAALTGGGIVKSFLEWLYHITGQRQETSPHIGGIFAPYGFDAVMLQEDCPRSIAQVIIAQKKG